MSEAAICTCPNMDTIVGSCQRHGDAARRTSGGIPTQPAQLANRYRNALTDALTALRAFGNEADAKEIEDRYSLIYIDPKPEVRLSRDVPPGERLLDDVARG